MVAAADAERRRIERDLHDGAQQRLVALAMTLGRAKATEDPALARTLVGEAHGEAKEALVELRNLARGIHPAVLTDRGLDAAVERARGALPDPGRGRRRPPAPRRAPHSEAIAYFVVAEALTNVAKHAQATRAWLTVEYLGDRLVVEVLDNGARRRARRPASASAACATASAPSTATCTFPARPAGERPCEWSCHASRDRRRRRAAARGPRAPARRGRLRRRRLRRRRRGAAALRREAPARRLRRRHPDAADVLRRGRARGAGDPQAVAGRVAADALPVRRGALRGRPAGRATAAGSATCSRTASPTSPSSSRRCAASPPAAPRWTPRSSPSCWCAPAARTRSSRSRRASARSSA